MTSNLKLVQKERDRLHDQMCEYDKQIGEACHLEVAIGSMEPGSSEVKYLVIHYRMQAEELAKQRDQARVLHEKLNKAVQQASAGSSQCDVEPQQLAT